MSAKNLLFLVLIILSGIVVFGAILFAYHYFAFQYTYTPLLPNNIGVIKLNASIEDATATTVRTLAEKATTDRSIKAVIVYINSPGGEAVACQEVYETLVRLRNEKPVVAYLGTQATSGAYWVALGATKIVSNPATLTGSFGVEWIIPAEITDYEEYFKRHKIFKAGKYKGLESKENLTEEEKALFQQVVDDIHREFLNTIQTERKITNYTLDKVREAQIITGSFAKELGLVD
ncbi:MAG: S49 family peptidase, partial [Euryarchaeota archaeon]|nr:S49 family peptidase [Euryarchaeota archaeon]